MFDKTPVVVAFRCFFASKIVFFWFFIQSDGSALGESDQVCASAVVVLIHHWGLQASRPVSRLRFSSKSLGISLSLGSDRSGRDFQAIWKISLSG